MEGLLRRVENLNKGMTEMQMCFPNGWKCQGEGCTAGLPGTGPYDGGLDKYCAKCSVHQAEVSEAHKLKVKDLDHNIKIMERMVKMIERKPVLTVPEDRLRKDCEAGNLEAVKGKPKLSPYHMYRSGCMKAAIDGRHTEIVLYLYKAYYIMHDKSAQFGIIPMCQQGRLDMLKGVQELKSKHPHVFLAELRYNDYQPLKEAHKSGQTEVVEWILKICPEGGSKVSRLQAATKLET